MNPQNNWKTLRLSMKTHPEGFVVCLHVRSFLVTNVPFLTCDDLSKQLLRRVSEERHAAHQELVEDDPHGPPIHRLSITLAKNHLWSDVLRSAANLSKTTKKQTQRWGER